MQHGAALRRLIFSPQTEDEITGEKSHYTVLRLYHVFNASQCEGLKNISSPAAVPATVNTTSEEIVALMPKRPEIKHGLAKAFYSPGVDIVAMPDRARFDSEAGYYATLFHELTHATGHASRLNRPTLTESAGFGSNPYCREELVAELGAAFLCGHAGIENTIQNSAAYLQNWLEALQNPYVMVHDGLAARLKAHKEWKDKRYPDSPWFFPNYRDPVNKLIDSCAASRGASIRTGAGKWWQNTGWIETHS